VDPVCATLNGYAQDMAKRTAKGSDIPSTIERSGKKAQETWAAAHDSAVDSYGEGERAHRTAFSALKHTHEKVGDHWEPKEEYGPSDERAEEGGPDSDTPTAGGVDANASKKHLMEVARKLDVRGRSSMTKDELVEAIGKANDRESAKSLRKGR
jgi:cation transport regulator ChaB